MLYLVKENEVTSGNNYSFIWISKTKVWIQSPTHGNSKLLFEF